MPQNLELKARFANYEEVKKKAEELSETKSETVQQVDTYYIVPVGRLKLRQFSIDHAELIWYDRDESSSHRLSQYEKTEVSPDAPFLNIISDELGTSVVVNKNRTIFHWNNCRIHLDVVDGLGNFIEFEVMLDEQDDGNKRMMFLREYFNIKDEYVVLNSYSDLLARSDNSRVV